MAATARRRVTVTFSGDVEGEQEIDAANNATSPASIEVVALDEGPNTITVPSGASAVTIMKDGANTGLITLKGVNGDTGFKLHDTDPDSISIDSTMTSFILNAFSATTVRLFWS